MRQPENQSLLKLRSLVELLQLSGRFLFQNYNLKFFVNFLNQDPDLSIILINLSSKYPQYISRFNQQNRPDQQEINNMRNAMTSFEENVAFCFSYLSSIVGVYFQNINLGINDFISPTSDDDRRQQMFIDECIKPIQAYLELRVSSALSAINILKRYKVYCEWYGKKELLSFKETDLTRNHLARFLFDSGFTYPLVEVDVPSGRIDNVAGDPYSIIVEAKIHDSGEPKKAFNEVLNQAYKRTQDLNLPEAFCVIYNKEEVEIEVNGADGAVEVFFYKVKNNVKIYFLVVNIFKKVTGSTESLTQKKVDLSQLVGDGKTRIV